MLPGSKKRNRKRKRTHGFLARQRKNGKSVVKKRRRKGRKRLSV